MSINQQSNRFVVLNQIDNETLNQLIVFLQENGESVRISKYRSKNENGSKYLTYLNEDCRTMYDVIPCGAKESSWLFLFLFQTQIDYNFLSRS